MDRNVVPAISDQPHIPRDPAVIEIARPSQALGFGHQCLEKMFSAESVVALPIQIVFVQRYLLGEELPIVTTRQFRQSLGAQQRCVTMPTSDEWLQDEKQPRDRSTPPGS